MTTTLTLANVAKKHGWTFEQTGTLSTVMYIFEKDKRRVTFTRQGLYGKLTVQWGNHVVPWTSAFEHDGTKYRASTTPREAYADVLLGLVTEEECKRRIEERLRQHVADAEADLAMQQSALATFLSIS